MPVRLNLHGMVQGVCCRYYCSLYAQYFQIHGAASNLFDGTVEVLLDCDDSQRINQYCLALQTNPQNYMFYGKINHIDKQKYSGNISGDYQF